MSNLLTFYNWLTKSRAARRKEAVEPGSSKDARCKLITQLQKIWMKSSRSRTRNRLKWNNFFSFSLTNVHL